MLCHIYRLSQQVNRIHLEGHQQHYASSGYGKILSNPQLGVWLL